MYRICVVLFFGAWVSGCGLKVERPREMLVTDIAMPAGEEFAPGSPVTVTATGFESGDEIWFEIAWTDGSEEFAPEGLAKGIRGVVTERTAESVTFLAPGHYPPSTVGVQLFRSGVFQTLGTIRVSDGVQHETFLYTLAESADGCSVSRCPMYGAAGMCEEVLRLDQPLSGVVGNFGPGTACGVTGDRLVELDLVTRHTQELGEGCLLVGSASESAVVGLYGCDDRLYLSGGTSQPYSWQLPEGVTLDRIVRQPFVHAFRALLLAVRNDDGTLSPLVLPLSGGSRALLGPGVASEYLIPYWTMKPSADDPARYERVGGYAAQRNGWSWFRPLDPATLELEPALENLDLVVKGRLLSMTQCVVAGDAAPEVRIGVLIEDEGRPEIWICDPQSASGSLVLGNADLSAVGGIFFAR